MSTAGPEYIHKTSPLGIPIDITNIAEVLDALDSREASKQAG